MIKRNAIYSSVFLLNTLSTLLVFIIGCSAAQSAKGLYETFYIGNDGLQYFIHPLTFNGISDNDNELKIDLTCKYKTVIKDSSIVNISLISAKNIRSIDSIIIRSDSCSVLLNDLNIMYTERNGESFISRFTTKSPLRGIKQLFDKSDWLFIVYAQNQSFKYITPANTQEKIDALNYNIFMLF